MNSWAATTTGAAACCETVEFNLDTNRVRIRDYSPIADRYLPNSFTAQENDGTIRNFSASNFGFDLDLKARFGLPNGAGITRSTSFQQGVNGYTGTRDTYVNQAQPDTNFGEAQFAWVDGDTDANATGNQAAQALIRFGSIVGDNAIPAGAQIVEATLSIHTSDVADAQSPNTISLFRNLAGWQEGVATWNTKGNGISTNGSEAIIGANDAAVPSVRNGWVTFDVTESVWAWAQGASNDGWVLMPGGNNGWRFDTSEAAIASLRPVLNVTYTVVPEPASLTAVAPLALLSMRRRRRC